MVGATAQQLLLIRSIGAAVVLVPLVVRNPHSIRVTGQWPLHVLRVACMTCDSFAFYAASKFLPLADVMTFYLAAPLIITALSVPFLGERVGPFRWTAVLVGFVGVVIALRPTGDAISTPALIALGGSCLFACSIIVTRKLRNSPWLGLIFWQFVASGIVGAATSPIGWVTPSLWEAGLMALVGIMAIVCFIAITKSLQLADASVVAPLQYTSIVWAGLMGWLVWGDIPDRAMTCGIVVIVASGLAVWWREQTREAVSPTAVPVP